MLDEATGSESPYVTIVLGESQIVLSEAMCALLRRECAAFKESAPSLVILAITLLSTKNWC